MYAIHMTPSGSSYTATKEEFVSRSPLPLTDCTVGHDGALYFTVGGRGAQSELYRVTYVGKEDVKTVDAKNPSDNAEGKLRAERRQVEAFHAGTHDALAVRSGAFRELGVKDRHIRYAARVAAERLPSDKLLNYVDEAMHSPDTLITACVALARQAEPSVLPKVLNRLGSLEWEKLTEEQQLGLLRAYQLAFIRLGNPEKDTCAALAKKFDDLFPQKSDSVNRELAILMIHFQSPNAAKKLVPVLTRERVASQEQIGDLLTRNKGYGGTIAAMLANQPDQMQYHYAFHLRNLKAGWTIDERKTYFAWFEKARTWSGGASYPKFLTNIDNEAFANCTDAERLAIEASGVRKPYVTPALPKPVGPGKEYTVQDVLALAGDQLKGRDFKNGETMFKAARCVVCHRFGGDGGATGPDLTQLAGRFNLKDLTDAIVDPSKVISDQFIASTVETKGGKVYTGKIVSDTKETITLVIDPENATKTIEIKKSEIESSQASKVSMMPKDLLKTLNPDEIRDLLAYLLSRGNPQDAMFRK